jgi:hypothetical protein
VSLTEKMVRREADHTRRKSIAKQEQDSEEDSGEEDLYWYAADCHKAWI